MQQLNRFVPSLLLLLDKDENVLYEVSLQIREEYEGEAVPLVANVHDRAHLERLFKRHRP